MRRMALKAKKIFKRLSGRESGQILIMVLIMTLLGAVILTPLLSFTISGMKQGQANQQSTDRFYAADSGVEDAMWKIRNYEDTDWPSWMQGEWTEATYTHSPAYDNYTIAQPAGVNGKSVTVRIQPTWILEGLVTPKAGQGRTANDNVTVTGNVTSAGHYEAAIVEDNYTGSLMIDQIGVWLPTGFNYVAGSSNLESLSDPLPPGGSRCTPTVVPFRNGTAIIWSYSTPINFTTLLTDESGVANSRKANHLVDSVNNQFTASDVGRPVYNVTDDKWGLISAYNSPSDLTLATDLFDNGNERYMIGDANRRVVSFTFTYNSSKPVPDGAFCWASSPGTTTPYIAPYLWWSTGKLYQIVSTGTDPSTGKLTSITAYTSKEELTDLSGAVSADYEATGNAFLRDSTPGDNGYMGTYRDRLYLESPGVISAIPALATVQQLRLYWSGWQNNPWNVWPLTDAQRSVLVTNSRVDRVELKISEGGVTYETTVYADSWQVLPNGDSSSPHGWSYSCYAAVNTDTVIQYFATNGVTFDGNATYTVGHATGSEGTTNSLQGIWGSASNDVFDVGNVGTILHYDGNGWSLMTSGTTSNLYEVWGSSSTNVFAVGDSGTILHYDGSTWTSMTSGTSNTLYDVWGYDGTHVYAVGASGTVLYTSNGGTSWSTVATGSGTTQLNGVWASDASHVFVVGASGTVRYYNGSSWGNAPGTTGSGTTRDLYGVWGTSSTNVYAVGASRTVMKYNGSSWSQMDYSSSGATLYGVWGYDANHVYVVGASGTARYTSNGGTSWSTVTTGSGTTQLNGVWGSGSSDVYVVGGNGTIRHYNGTTWATIIGAYSLFGWVNGHSGETSVATTDYPLATAYTTGSSGTLDEWAYGAWSMIVIYSSPETKGHQLYIYDTFRYMDHYGGGSAGHEIPMNFAIQGFLAPQDVLYNASAARLTCFVGEGDWIYPNSTYPDPDQILVNNTILTDPPGFPAVNSSTNVWNSRSNIMTPSPDGIDIDTFYAGNGIIQPGDDSALVSLKTGIDVWNLIYIVLSFRSDITTGGIASIKVT